MGTEMADAIRSQLRAALLAVYGSLDDAAVALNIPYKTLRRHLSASSKDRTARVSLDFVLDVADHLNDVANVDLAEIYRRAQLSATDASPRQSDLGLAARGRDEDRGEEIF